ncbi:MAG: LPD29 domain-containing protein, partial [bacterium]
KTMAFINKEKTKVIRNEIKKQFPRKDGWKFSVVNENHSSIHVSIMEAPVRFHEKDYAQLNHYYPENYENSEILSKIKVYVHFNYNWELAFNGRYRNLLT